MSDKPFALCFLGLLVTACLSDGDKLPLGTIAVLAAVFTVGMIVYRSEKAQNDPYHNTEDDAQNEHQPKISERKANKGDRKNETHTNNNPPTSRAARHTQKASGIKRVSG